MNRGAVLQTSLNIHAPTGPGYNGGLEKPFQSGTGSDRNIATTGLVFHRAPDGPLSYGILSGLFTRIESGKKPPTQNDYSIKSVILVNVPPLPRILNSGGLK